MGRFFFGVLLAGLDRRGRAGAARAREPGAGGHRRASGAVGREPDRRARAHPRPARARRARLLRPVGAGHALERAERAARADTSLAQRAAGRPRLAVLRAPAPARERAERDICLGKATRLDNGLRIVDWRHAPISQLFYRYQQGDEYEEEIGGRVRERRDRDAPHRDDPRRPRCERVEAPEGDLRPGRRRGRRLAARGPSAAAARRRRGRGAARPRVGDGGARRLGTDPPAPRSAPTSTCPTSPA